MSARRATPRKPRKLPLTWMVWLVATAMLATLAVLAVVAFSMLARVAPASSTRVLQKSMSLLQTLLVKKVPSKKSRKLWTS